MTLSLTRTLVADRRRPPWRSAYSAVLGAALLALVLPAAARAAAVPPSDPTPRTVRADVPSGVTAGVAVFDRGSGSFTEQINLSLPLRSASVVKLLIALDLLGDRGPDALGAQDRARVDAMLRASDDDAAGHFWTVNGGGAIIDRMVRKLGLTDTARPPATHPGYWGYTALSARDTVRIYRYLLDAAPAVVRDYVMEGLRSSTRCADDGYDQHFGIPSAFERPWAVKQGWSGFSSGGCTTPAAATPTARTGGPAAVGVELGRPALHSTGTVGPDDRAIVVVLTLHPDGTSYGNAYTALGRLTRSLNVPGATRPVGTWIGTWGSDVNVRADSTTNSRKVAVLPAGAEVLASCQKRGQEVSTPPYTNDWWAYLPQYGGYVTNIYLSVPENQVPGLRLC